MQVNARYYADLNGFIRHTTVEIQPPKRIIAQVRRCCACPAHQPVFHVIDKAARSIACEIAIGIITERRRTCTDILIAPVHRIVAVYIDIARVDISIVARAALRHLAGGVVSIAIVQAERCVRQRIEAAGRVVLAEAMGKDKRAVVRGGASVDNLGDIAHVIVVLIEFKCIPKLIIQFPIICSITF